MSLGPNDNKQYGAPDFERYYSGGMTAQEMHALEKAALDDPFLADALEGYKATRTPVADVAWLKEQLTDKTQKTKVVPLVPKKSYPFLRIAALVLLLLGAGWSVYYLADGRKDSLALEQKEEKTAATEQAPPAVVAPDTVQQQTLTFRPESAPEASSTAAAPERRRATKPAAGSEKATAAAAPAPVTEVQDADAGQPMLLREKEARDVAAVDRKQVAPQAVEGRAAGITTRGTGSVNVNTFRGRVVDANNQAVPNATVSLRTNRTGVTTDEQGYFVLNAPDTTVNADVSAIGFDTKNITLNQQKKENNIVLQENASGLSEVVVTGYGKPKKRTQVGAAGNALLEPVQGWAHFEAYLQKNRKPSSELSPQGLKGLVVLSFEANRKGAPTDIKVDSSLSPLYDAEAIRLLREGPKWQRIKDARGKVTIPFQ